MKLTQTNNKQAPTKLININSSSWVATGGAEYGLSQKDYRALVAQTPSLAGMLASGRAGT